MRTGRPKENLPQQILDKMIELNRAVHIPELAVMLGISEERLSNNISKLRKEDKAHACGNAKVPAKNSKWPRNVYLYKHGPAPSKERDRIPGARFVELENKQHWSWNTPTGYGKHQGEKEIS